MLRARLIQLMLCYSVAPRLTRASDMGTSNCSTTRILQVFPHADASPDAVWASALGMNAAEATMARATPPMEDSR